jgi:hypothetical protein
MDSLKKNADALMFDCIECAAIHFVSRDRRVAKSRAPQVRVAHLGLSSFEDAPIIIHPVAR